MESKSALRTGLLGRARPDTGALVERYSLSAWPRGRQRRPRSLLNSRRVRAGKSWRRRGRLLTAGILADGGAFHPNSEIALPQKNTKSAKRGAEG